MTGEILRMRSHDIIAFALDVAAVEVEVDDALGQQATLRAGDIVIGPDVARIGGIRACARSIGARRCCPLRLTVRPLAWASCLRTHRH